MSFYPSFLLFTGICTILSISGLRAQPASTAESGASLVDHVLVIGVDGMSPDGIRRAATPNIDYLVDHGAATFRARGVLPTSSSPNWASMITGAGPEQHGITSNDWEKDDFVLPGAAADADGYFPSIFNLIHDQRPGAESAAIYHWEGFGRLFNNTLVDLSISPESEDATTEKAVAYWEANRPLFCFVHLDHVDGAGHSEGHGTAAYYQAVSKADSLIGLLLETLRRTQMLDHTLVILSADHGGTGFGHGGETPEELLIPFIMYGKGIKPGYAIQSAVNTMDNAATAAFALGLAIPNAWTGRPVTEAFVGYPGPDITYPVPELVGKPIIHPQGAGFDPPGGLFLDEVPELRIVNPDERGVIRYTLNGESPDHSAPIYEGAMPISKNTVVKAAVFVENQKVSDDAVGYFRIHTPNPDNGVHYRTYPVDGIEKLPAFEQLPVAGEGTIHEVGLDRVSLPREEQIAVQFDTHLQVETAGTYQFYLASDDGSKLWVNDKMVVDNDGNHGLIERSGKIDLPAGRHRLQVQWYNGGGGKGLYLFYKGPGTPKQLVPASRLFLPD